MKPFHSPAAITPTEAVRVAYSPPRKRKRLWQHLYFWVLLAIAAGVVVGLVWPDFASGLQWLATLFINLVKMIIAPTIFATVVVGIAGLGNLAKAGGLAARTIAYFLAATTFALAMGMVVANIVQPGAIMGLDLADFDGSAAEATIAATGDHSADGIQGLLLSIVPTSFVGAFTGGSLLQVLLLAILTAVAVTMLGKRGQKVVYALDTVAKIMFGIIKLVMWVAPVGAFGGIAYTIGMQGPNVLGGLAYFVATYWLACILFVVGVLGLVALFVGFNIFKYLRYIKDELLIVLGTSSSETVLPRMMVKLEAAGVPRHVVGLTIPTGYSFNLDGTAMYMSLGALFIAQAFGIDVPLGTQIAMLAFMILSSKGAAGVSGAGLVTLAASMAAFDDVIPMVGLALIVGVDRFMSEGRSLTNLAGNGVGTLVIAAWTRDLDRARLRRVLDDPKSVDVDELMREQDLTEHGEEGELELRSEAQERASAIAASSR